MTDNKNLIERLPTFMREFKEMECIMEAEQGDFNVLYLDIMQTMADRFAVTAGVRGVARFEKMLGIIPKANETLEARRFRILSYLNDKPPYTESNLRRYLDALCGREAYFLEINCENSELSVRITLPIKHLAGEVGELLAKILPANIFKNISLVYNHWGLIGSRTWGFTVAKIWRDIKEEVL